MRTWWGLASTAGADGRLEVVGADRAGRRHEIRLFFACGPPGRSYRQKTNLTSGDLWVWVMTSDDLWVWANSAEFDEILPDLDFGLFIFGTKISFSGQMAFSLVFGAQLWPFWAQTDLYPLLINLVVVVGCFRGSGRRVRQLLSQASGWITQCIDLLS